MKIQLYTTLVTLILTGLLASSAVYANTEEDLDPLDLAALLISNKNYSRAAAVLGGIKNPHDVIPERYFALKGILELKQKRYQEALDAFRSAQKEGLKSVDLYEGLAEAYLGLKDYDKGIEVLDSHKDELVNRLRFYQLKSNLLFEKKDATDAWIVLHKGIQRFPKELSLMKQKWYYLMENHLYEVSYEAATQMVDHYSMSALDLARMGQMYRNANQFDKAIMLGEVARLKDPKDEEITKDLVRSYVKVGNITASAKLFTELAQYHPEYLVEASELWRKAGHEMMAKNLAMEIRNPVKKLKQNITLALLSEDFNKMVLLGEQGQRTELKNDQDIQYALAYASFMVGDYKTTENYLTYIQRPDLFKKALALREAMIRCTEEVALCF